MGSKLAKGAAFGWCIAVLVWLSSAAAAQSRDIHDADELAAALTDLSGGQTLFLAGGDYGALRLQAARYGLPLRLQAKDRQNPPVFSALDLEDVANLTFDGVHFSYTYMENHKPSVSRFKIVGSQKVTIDNAAFLGDVAQGTGTTADGTGFGRALRVVDSRDIIIANSTFHTWWKALGVSQTQNAQIIGNVFYNIRTDGISLGRVSGVLVAQNHIHSFRGAPGLGDHRDMIQIMRASGDGSRDVTLRGNVLDMADGDYTQGIFIGRDKGDVANADHWHKNIVIQDNVLRNAHANGIAVQMTDGLLIQNNRLETIARQETGGVTVPKIIVSDNSRKVVISDNATPGIVGFAGQSDWFLARNVQLLPR